MSHSISSDRIRDASRRHMTALRYSVLTLLAALIAACGGGDGSSSLGGGGPSPSGCDASSCGTAMVTVTDAPGDFLTYTVDVTSLQLKKADGTVVQTLPMTTRIDFAQLVDLSEVLSAGQIPPGEYVAATLGVDFSNASIVYDDGTASGMVVNPVDGSGQPLGVVQMNVELDHRNHLLINAKRISNLAFDLDLSASNTVDTTAHTVTVSPTIVASLTPPASRDTRLRGKLDSVDVTGSSYTIDVRPFHVESSTLGQLVVHTTSTTSFEINGSVYTGVDGLTQLAGLTTNPVTVAFGSIDTTDHSFTARRVLAGTSVEDSSRDYLSGVVLSRSGMTLNVGGVQLDRRDGRFGFQRGAATVTIGTNTKVTREGQMAGTTLDIGAISVGQRIEVLGQMSTDSSGNVTIDATAGRVRLDYTRLFGTVSAVTSGGLTMTAQYLDGRDVARFNFAGTGQTTAQDSNPASYEVATGALNLTGLVPGAYTRLFGFVAPFGMAPPDFTADTFLDFTDTRADLAVGWGPAGSKTPFLVVSGTGLTVDLGSTALRGAIELGGRLIDLHTLSTLLLVPATSGELEFAIAHRSSRMVDNFSTFADFETQLAADLNGTTALLKLAGEGTFNAPGGVYTAQRLLVVLSD